MHRFASARRLFHLLGVSAAGLVCSACLFPEEDSGTPAPPPNVVGCACNWKAGTSGKYEKANGTLTCEGPWTAGKSDLEVEKNTAVDDCLVQAKVKAGANGPSYNCVCACDPSYVASGASSSKMICK